MEKPYKRRIYFIERSFQARFILKFCLLVVLAGILTIGVLYFLAMRSTTVSIAHSRVVVRTTADFILPLLVQTVVIVSVLVGLATILVTLFVSHKIAGPLYRFKMVMQALSSGDFSTDFRIRHLDQLQDIAVAFNAMIGKIRSELKSLKENFRSLREKLDAISEHEVAEHKRGHLSDLKRLSQELDKIIHYFKT
jgi:methyl-accepting chemotaxis protein